MSEVKWIKITTDIFDDEKIKLIDAMPDNDALLVIWFKLLAMAGKVNDNGLIYIVKKMPITDEMLATLFNRPLNTVRLALDTFSKFGMIEINEHINIVNWEKHQNIQGLEKIREQARIRQERHRNKKALSENCYSNVTVTLHNATEEDIEEEKENNIYSLSADKVPYQDLVNLYHEVLPMLPKSKVLTDKRKNLIKKLWMFVLKEKKFENKEQALDFFRRYFESVGRSRFLTGENNRDWKANIEFVFSEKCFLDKYENGCKYK